MVSPEMARYREGLVGSADGSTAGPPSVAQVRAGSAGWIELAAEPVGVSWEAAEADRPAGEWALPTGADEGAAVLYLHGGAYFSGSPATHRRLAGHVATATGARVFSAAYRLAPEHPFPAALEDSVAAYRFLLATGIDPGRIAVGGDSAGGGLALATLLRLRELELPRPGAGFAFSAWTDLTLGGESIRTLGEADPLFVGIDAELEYAALYLGDADPRDPLVSPRFGEFHDLPPLLLQVGALEAGLDDSRAVAAGAAAAGIDVTLEVWPEMLHVFQFAAGRAPEADEALRRLGAWLRDRLRIA
jgi:acetyl esterase/lipase